MKQIGDSKQAAKDFSIVNVGIVFGRKGDGEKASTLIQLRKQHFHPHVGWELKDVVIMGLPQSMRFAVVTDFERFDTSNAVFYAIYAEHKSQHSW